MGTTTNTATTATISPFLSNLIAIIILIVLVFILVQKHRKKVGKPPIKIMDLFKKKNTEDQQKSGNKWYGNYEKLITVDAFKKLKSYVVFDLETTGLDADKNQIIEIGAVRVAAGKITDQSFHQMIDPGCHIPNEASAVNHITDDMVKGQKKIKDVLPYFLDFVDNDVLVAHNGGFDAAFLDNACMRCGLNAPKKYFDTMRLSVYWPNLKNRKLVTMLQAAGIENDEAHRAMSDAIATAKLCIKSMEKIK